MRTRIDYIVLATAVFAASLAARAQSPIAPGGERQESGAATEASAGVGASGVIASNPVTLEAFVDGVMAEQQQAKHIAGGVVVVVADGRIVLEKGYGYADVAERRPVDPARTLFHIASNSKMFLWTAVMQLVEQGRLDLDADVNRYLEGVQLPSTYPEPITLAHLMTHTAGFADTGIGLFSLDGPEGLSLLEAARQHRPDRIFPPGRLRAYSNYGALLAALIVEQVSGVPYARYVQERILDPLGMSRTTLAEPVPVPLRADLATGYRWLDGRFVEQPVVSTAWAGPAAAMSTTGHDMARFMTALLQGGALDGARILGPETVRRLREPLIPVSPLTNFLHGFVQLDLNGEPAFGHTGDYEYFHSMTAMLPERSVGLFIALNTDTGLFAHEEFFEAFMDRYYPRPPQSVPPPEREPGAGLERFAGSYAPTRRAVHDMTKMVMLFGAVRIAVDSDGYLISRSLEGTRRWRRIGALVFAEVDGRRRLAFREDEAGDIRYADTSPLPGWSLDKQPWWNAEPVNRLALIVGFAVLAAGLIGYPVAAALERRQSSPGLARIARLAIWLASLGLVSGWIAVVPIVQYPTALAFGVPPALRVSYALWLAGALCTGGALAFCVMAWRRRWWEGAGRVSYSIVCAAALSQVVWLAHWKLLGVGP